MPSLDLSAPRLPTDMPADNLLPSASGDVGAPPGVARR
jgi:hypothetical protein